MYCLIRLINMILIVVQLKLVPGRFPYAEDNCLDEKTHFPTRCGHTCMWGSRSNGVGPFLREFRIAYDVPDLFRGRKRGRRTGEGISMA